MFYRIDYRHLWDRFSDYSNGTMSCNFAKKFFYSWITFEEETVANVINALRV